MMQVMSLNWRGIAALAALNLKETNGKYVNTAFEDQTLKTND